MSLRAGVSLVQVGVGGKAKAEAMQKYAMEENVNTCCFYSVFVVFLVFVNF